MIDPIKVIEGAGAYVETYNKYGCTCYKVRTNKCYKDNGIEIKVEPTFSCENFRISNSEGHRNSDSETINYCCKFNLDHTRLDISFDKLHDVIVDLINMDNKVASVATSEIINIPNTTYFAISYVEISNWKRARAWPEQCH